MKQISIQVTICKSKLFRSRYILHHRALTNTEQQAIKGPKNDECNHSSKLNQSDCTHIS